MIYGTSIIQQVQSVANEKVDTSYHEAAFGVKAI